MTVTQRNLKQDVTHWAVTKDGYGGNTYAAPVALKGRWEDRSVRFRGPSGDEINSKSVVFLSAEVAENDYIFLGISVAADPSTLPEAFQVASYLEIPDLRNLGKVRKALL